MKINSRRDRNARGRNGWFAPTEMNIISDGHGITIEVRSKTPGKTPPILMYLSMEDVLQIEEELIQLVTKSLSESDQDLKILVTWRNTWSHDEIGEYEGHNEDLT